MSLFTIRKFFIIRSFVFVFILISTFLHAEEECYEFIPRVKVLQEDNFQYSSTLTKEIFKIDSNQPICLKQKELDVYYQDMLTYFIEVKGYYIPPIVKVDFSTENDINYGNFLVTFQKVNKIVFDGTANNNFFGSIIHLSSGDEFKANSILKDQNFFNSVGLSLDGFDVNQTEDEKFDAVYVVNQDSIWFANISLSNSQSETYNAYGNLSSYLSFGLINPFGLAWQYNLDVTSSRLFSKEKSYSDYFGGSVTIPLQSFKFTAQASASDNVADANVVDFNVVSRSFYSGQSSSESFNLDYDTSFDDEYSAGVSAGMKFDQYTNFSFVNYQALSGNDNSSYGSFNVSVNAAYSNPKLSLSSEVKYTKLIPELSNLEITEIYYSPGQYYKDNYSFINYTLNAYVPISDWGLYSMSLYGQYTSEVLRDVNKLAVGDRNTVRGFGDNYQISADSGFFVRNEMAVEVKDWINPYIAYDYTDVIPTVRSTFEFNGARFSGASIGARGVFHDVNYELFLAYPVTNSLSGFDDGFSFGYSLDYKI